MGIHVQVTGAPAGAGLIASNHLSYLDILVYSAIAPCAFVAKREVRAWPAVGWIATLAGTIYVDRSRRSETHTIQPEIQSALAAGLRLFLFPEGTSSDGSRVLPFHSSLFQPAVDLQVPVSAASIEYAIPDGVAAAEACYFGTMTLLPTSHEPARQAFRNRQGKLFFQQLSLYRPQAGLDSRCMKKLSVFDSPKWKWRNERLS